MSSSIPSLSRKKEGEYLNSTARFPITFVGEWSSILSTNSIDVLVQDNIHNQPIQWTEGPLYISHENALYFTEVPLGIIYKISVENEIQTWAIECGGVDPKQVPHLAESGSNGMAQDFKDKDLIYICQQYNHSIIKCHLTKHTPGNRLKDAPGFEVICSTTSILDSESSKLNSPNDIVVHPTDGSVWFTDPIYGLLESKRWCDEWNASEGSYLDKNCVEQRSGITGVYVVDKHKTNMELFSSFHRRPNGLAFSPDANYLWVADSTVHSPTWTCYDIHTKQAQTVLTPAILGSHLGHVSNKLMLGLQGISDGFKIDDNNRMWTSIANGIAVIDLNTNKLICQILFGVNTSNVAFGLNGEVFITGSAGVWRLNRLL